MPTTNTPVQASAWPARHPEQATAVLKEEWSDTHVYTYFEDGVLSISVDELLLEELEHIPEFVQQTKLHPGYVVLNRHNLKVLKRILNELDI